MAVQVWSLQAVAVHQAPILVPVGQAEEIDEIVLLLLLHIRNKRRWGPTHSGRPSNLIERIFR